MTTPWESPSDDIIDARDEAQFGSSLGIAAMALCLLGSCTMCSSLLLAVPVAVLALRASLRAQNAAGEDELTLTLSRIGIATGAGLLIYGTLVLLLLVLYVGIYALVFGMAMASAAAGI